MKISKRTWKLAGFFSVTIILMAIPKIIQWVMFFSMVLLATSLWNDNRENKKCGTSTGVKSKSAKIEQE